MAGGWILRRAKAADLAPLMRWFPDAAATRRWGGPKFRYPFDDASFRADCRWDEIDSWVLDDAAGERVGFGQYYVRDGYINLARIAVHPERRGSGAGRRLMLALMREAERALDLPAFSLFVYRDNAPAVRLYRRLGFDIADYPADVELGDVCWFMTRPRDAV